MCLEIASNGAFKGKIRKIPYKSFKILQKILEAH